MKYEYKLKKWYPSLPDDWEEGDIVKLEKRRRFYIHTNSIMSLKLSLEEVENNPEFWEEVVEKNYMILQFRGGSYGKTPCSTFGRLTTDSNSFIKLKGDIDQRRFSEEKLLESGARIHQVKRLSDGL